MAMETLAVTTTTTQLSEIVWSLIGQPAIPAGWHLLMRGSSVYRIRQKGRWSDPFATVRFALDHYDHG